MYPLLKDGLLLVMPGYEPDKIKYCPGSPGAVPNNAMTLLVMPGVNPGVLIKRVLVLLDAPTGVTPFIGEDGFTPIQHEMAP